MKYLCNGVSLQNGRQSNMDSLLLKSRHIAGRSAALAVVCDGVGSLADGAFASGTAAVMLSEWFDKLAAVERIGLIMRDTVLEINSRIVMQAGKNNLDTASTLSAILLVENDYFIVHIGDSRIYSCADGELSMHTGDDVSQSGKLLGYIGKHNEIFLQYSEGTAAGKVFLICSDGLYKRMDESFMSMKMKNLSKRSIKEAIESLPQYVIRRGEQDNITLAIIKIID